MSLAAVEAGAHVIGIARSEDELAETAALAVGEAGSFSPWRADLSRHAEIDSLVRRIGDEGPILGVVHAAATQIRKPAEEVTLEDWERVLALNLTTPFLLSVALARSQRTQGAVGSHVFVGSLASSIGLPRIAPYVAAKSGLIGVMRALAVEYAEHAIRFNALCPGYLQTRMTDDLLTDADQRNRVLGRIPMRRLGEADDLAGAVVYLLSDASSYVTGQVVNVDGGWLAA